MGEEAVDSLRIYDELLPTLGEKAARKLATLLGSMYVDLRDVVRREDFRDLHAIVGELAESDQRIDAKLVQIAEFQKRTDARFAEMAEAQARTDAKLEQLAEAQRDTEAAVKHLAEAQARTEAAVYHNSIRIDRLNKQYGGLSSSWGYVLENEAYRHLPDLLRSEHGLEIEGRLRRDFLFDPKGREMEINILGRGSREGEQLLIVGECKSQLSKNNVDSFLRRRLGRIEPGNRKVFPIMVAHMISESDVIDYARGKGVSVYLSYQFNPDG